MTINIFLGGQPHQFEQPVYSDLDADMQDRVEELKQELEETKGELETKAEELVSVLQGVLVRSSLALLNLAHIPSAVSTHF